MNKYLIVRGNPTPWTELSYADVWGNYPTKERPFLLQYLELWDRQFQVTFFEGRQRLRELSLSCFEQLAVTDIVFQDFRQWQKNRGQEFEGLLFVSDDDDFLAPWLPEEAEQIVDGEHREFFWYDYCSGNMKDSLFDCGKLQREGYPHTNNILYDLRVDTSQKRPKRYEGADDIERTLSFYSSNPWSITAVRKMIISKSRFWKHYTLGERLTYFLRSYIRKSKEAFETLSDDVWFKHYWMKVVALTEETLGGLLEYEFPSKD